MSDNLPNDAERAISSEVPVRAASAEARTGSSSSSSNVEAPPPRRRYAAMVVGLLVATMGLFVWGYYLYYPAQIGAAQPVSFSHRFHVTEKKLSCIMCHGGTIDTPRAGVPPVETCMLCHSRIITTHPEIQKIRDAYREGRPIMWNRVNDVPEFVYFNHQVHVRRGFDCSRCHGDVAGMDRVEKTETLKMGFCVQCHRDNNYSHDCLVCHR